MRLDVRVARELGVSRAEAQEIIRGGFAAVNGAVVVKPGHGVDDTVCVEIRGGRRAFAGRGGDKLNVALDAFNVSVAGRVCLDVGASTGGFTDCLLQRGAAKVYAVENGVNQLAAHLRDDPRVVNIEETDIRGAGLQWFTEPITFVTVDVSFISLTKVLAPVASVLANGAEAVALIKPQYETGAGLMGRRGIIRDGRLQRKAADTVRGFAENTGFTVGGVIPYEQKDKNREFLMYMVYNGIGSAANAE
jgi:23S rRNA (cytidine1920-2'-O)/16S rRNA (cytidine1409-2'-O)-methyltransferase